MPAAPIARAAEWKTPTETTDRVKLERLDVRVVEIPMRFSVKHSLADRKTARNVFVSARGEGEVGWGECCPRPYVTGETVESVLATLDRRVFPRLDGASFATHDAVVETLTSLLDETPRGEQAALCAAELALLDLAGKTFGISAGEVLGPVVHPTVRYSGVIATVEPAAVERMCAFMKDFGTPAVKVKVDGDLERNLRLLETARGILGDEVALRVDANCAWTGEEGLRQLEAMRPYRLEGVEQPVEGDDLAGLRLLTEAKLVPVVVDESLCSLADAELLIRERACDVFNVRISKCGGLLASGRIRSAAAGAGLKCQLGAQVGESGILSAAGRHFATRSEGVLWCEGSYGSILLERDLTEPDLTVGPGGAGHALDSPGLGVAPVPELLERYTVS